MSVPDQLIGVRRWVVVSAAAVLVQIRADLKALRQAEQHLAAEVELPRIEVGIGLQLVARMLIVAPSVERHLEPAVTIAQVQPLGEIHRTRGVLLGISLMLRHIAHIMVIASSCVRSNIPMGCRVESCVERKTSVGIPVAIDVLGARNATTGLVVVAHEVRDAVARVAIITIHRYRALILTDVVVVVHVQRVGELRLQPRVSLCDVKRIRVVGDVEQLSNIWLSGIAPIVNPDITLL